MHTYKYVVNKFLSLFQILEVLLTSHVCIGHTCIEIKIEIWISYSSFIERQLFLV